MPGPLGTVGPVLGAGWEAVSRVLVLWGVRPRWSRWLRGTCLLPPAPHSAQGPGKAPLLTEIPSPFWPSFIIEIISRLPRAGTTSTYPRFCSGISGRIRAGDLGRAAHDGDASWWRRGWSTEAAKDGAWCRAWELLHLRSWQGNEGKDKTVKFKEEKRSWAGWRGERMWTD